jgi:trk system potassium uptake protein TrkA
MKFHRNESNTYAIIGLGRFGTAVAKQLVENGQEVILIDKDTERVRELRSLSDYAYVVNHLDQETLEEIGLSDCQGAVIAIGQPMDANILATLYCANLKVPVIVAKANSKEQGEILYKIGATKVVYPEKDMGERLANALSNQQVLDYFSVSNNIDIVQMVAPEAFHGKTLAELNLRPKWGVTVIAVKNGKDVTEEITADTSFKKGDVIVMIGGKDKIIQLQEAFS